MQLPPDLAGFVAEAAGATRVRRAERIQSLWSGYGELLRADVEGAPRRSVIVKWVRPPSGALESALSDARKRRSYEVETTFYRRYAARCSDACRVPRLLASRGAGAERLLVLEDLDAAGYAERRRAPQPGDLDACLSWLAAFHATFLGTEPDGLWEMGTYWHLATRPDELAAIDDDELREAAPILDQKLEASTVKTLVHGDAKLANFCFAPEEEAVAAVDFQYTGGGCGVKDVAYLLCRAVEGEEAEERHLDGYFRALRAALVERGAAAGFDELEAEWRALYPIAWADYHRFIAGWAKARWRSDARAQRRVRQVLRTL